MVCKLAGMTDDTMSKLQAHLHRMEFERNSAREERDAVRGDLKVARERIERMEEERTICDRRVSLALQEVGAVLERRYQEREEYERTIEQLATQNKTLSASVIELNEKTVKLNDRLMADPYRAVPPEALEALRGERDRLGESVRAAEDRRDAAERAMNTAVEDAQRARNEVASEHTRLRTRVAYLRRELNALARAAGVFRQHVSGCEPLEPFNLDYSAIDKAISTGLIASDKLNPPRGDRE